MIGGSLSMFLIGTHNRSTRPLYPGSDNTRADQDAAAEPIKPLMNLSLL
jgi:hypothetical protein